MDGSRYLEFTQPGEPLRLALRDKPQPGPGSVLLRVSACGVCRTDLHIVDGELPVLDHPVVPGHGIVAISSESTVAPYWQFY